MLQRTSGRLQYWGYVRKLRQRSLGHDGRGLEENSLRLRGLCHMRSATIPVRGGLLHVPAVPSSCRAALRAYGMRFAARAQKRVS